MDGNFTDEVCIHFGGELWAPQCSLIRQSDKLAK